MVNSRQGRHPRRTRGSSFIEIVVALAILALLMVGVLQMYSLALLTNYGSAARTELLYKAQQVVENLRLIYFLSLSTGDNTALNAAGVPATLAATAAPINLPYYNGDGSALKWDYWGDKGANVIDVEKGPYRLSYTVEDVPDFWLITVTATPVDNPRLDGTIPDATPTDNPLRYRGLGSKLKIVTYAAQIEKVVPTP